VLRDENGWHITEGGRQFLESLEAPLPVATGAPEELPSLAVPLLRLVVNNETRSPSGPEAHPARRSSAGIASTQLGWDADGVAQPTPNASAAARGSYWFLL
jgi:hypothetical protein